MSNNRINEGEHAHDFTLADTNDAPITLSDFEGDKFVYLIFNRGFQ